jgi:hypothetical protein
MRRGIAVDEGVAHVKRPRRQLLLKLGVFLLLGVVVNVAVAWGCAYWVDVAKSTADPSLSESDSPRWNFFLYAGFGSIRIGARAHDEYFVSLGGDRYFVPRRHLIPSWSRIRLRPNQDQMSEGKFFIEDARGWPFLAMYSTLFEKFGDRVIHYGLLLLADSPRGTYVTTMVRGLPTTPIWPGFAINTIFYAAMLWLLWVAPGKIRRFIRVHRGVCPECGYIIAPGTAAASGPGGPCSECGFVRTRL